MTEIILFLFFIIGSAIGSFLNVLIDRLPRGESVLIKRSHCDSCGRTLHWFDMFPVFSYLVLGGKCRHCAAKIGIRTFIIEGVTGLLFAIASWLLLWNVFTIPQFFLILIIISCFIVIFVNDIKSGIIPDQMLIAIFVATIVFVFAFDPSTLLARILSAVCSCLFYFLLFAFTKGKGMGFGDVKFAAVLGFLLPYPAIVVTHYVAFLTGAAISIILILWKKKKLHGATVPFGPFMITGAIIAYFYTDFLLKLFFNIVL